MGNGRLIAGAAGTAVGTAVGGAAAGAQAAKSTAPLPTAVAFTKSRLEIFFVISSAPVNSFIENQPIYQLMEIIV